MSRRKICVITGSRAEYGLLYGPMKEIENEHSFELQIVATGMHLSPEFGLTYKVIEEDGFSINAKVEMLLTSDTKAGIAKSIGLGVIGFADALDRLKPDLLVVLGDRFEIMAAVQAALVAKIPVAHIAGGDTTEGVIDEAFRHSITKMSHLHFVTNEISEKRVLQLGENPRFIYNVGHTGIDQIKKLRFLRKEELEQRLGFKFKAKNLLITFHAETLNSQPPGDQFKELLKALDMFGSDMGLIFTKPNCDTGGRVLIQMIDDYTAMHPHSRAYTSLGNLYYLNTMAQVDVVVGNSSSGLYEAPSFKKPTVNIGERQKGRAQAESVVNCPHDAAAIERAIRQALTKDCSDVENPYGDGISSSRIVHTLKQIKEFSSLIKKRFFDAELHV